MGNRPAVIGLQFLRGESYKENNLINELKFEEK